MLDLIKKEITNHQSLSDQLLESCGSDIEQLGQSMINTYKSGNKVILFGNGGSAADAQHIAAELVVRLLADRKPFPALSLTVNSSNLTAAGNDYGFDKLFSRQIEALAQPGDLAIGITTSGKSKNVVEGLIAAKTKGCKTAGLTGENPNMIGELCDDLIKVPSSHTSRIQEMHILIGHILCLLVETELA